METCMKKPHRIVLPILAVAFIAGCAAPVTTDIDYNEPDPLVFINTAFGNQIHTLQLYKALEKISDHISTANNYRYVQRWNCIGGDAVRNMVTRYCSSKGGLFRNGWCVDSRTEEPLFAAFLEEKTMESLRRQYPHVRDLSQFTQCKLGGERMEITAYAPRKDSTREQWLAAARSLGFKTSSQLNTEIAQRKKAEQEEIARRNYQRMQNYKVMMAPNSRGLQVCKKFNGSLYVANIEETAPAQGTMKVFVGKFCNYSGTNCFSRLGGFAPHSEWVNAEAEGWYPCR